MYTNRITITIDLYTVHCVQTDPAKNVWTRAYLIPERNRTGRRQEEGKNSVLCNKIVSNESDVKCKLFSNCWD
jgi:hypothetical protein